MATTPLGAESARINPASFTLTPGMAPAAPLMRLLASFDRPKVEAFAEISIALLDMMEPDPDLEDNNDREPSDGDDRDQGWIEWTTMRGAAKRGPNVLAGEEDDEDDDPHGGEIDEDVPGFTPRDLAIANALGSGPGCSIGDPGGCEHDGRERDEGVLCLPTPPLPVLSFEPNIFTDQRVRLDKEG